ncbi:unnamed protein product [Phytomonas sp. EM1]|nr:unnamed protein product [Phytomonas sp. EM1]|eukprot:CCW64282.1 unnamed protein product [Phytomonas sp. isolate EM1]
MKFKPLLFILVLLLFIGNSVVASPPDDETTRLLLSAGDKAMSGGREHYREALAKYTEAHVRSPRSERALYSRAQLLALLGEYKAALVDLDALLEQSPKHLQGLILRVSLNVQRGALEAALLDSAKLVKVYDLLGKVDKRREVQSQMVKLKHYYNRWQSLSDIMEAPLIDYQPTVQNTGMRRRYEECVELLEHIIRDFAMDSLNLRLRRASCALAAGDNQVVSNEVRRVLARDSQSLVAIVLNAKALRGLGSLDQCRSELRRCLSINPEFAPCAKLNRLVRNQQKHAENIARSISEKNFNRAVSEITAAMKEEEHPPNEEQLSAWLCKAYVGLLDTVKGHQECGRALKLLGDTSPAAADVHLDLAELFLMEDDLDKATQEAKKAKELDPRSDKADSLLHKIENIRRNGKRKDYYRILGVPKTASAQEIRRVYRKLAKEYHPDQLRSKDLSDEERSVMDKRFRDMNEAKEVLLDEEKRARYDAGEDVMRPQGQGGGGQPFYGQRFHFSTNGFPEEFAKHFFHQQGGGGGGQTFFHFR